jgi:hypothetical protein
VKTQNQRAPRPLRPCSVIPIPRELDGIGKKIMKDFDLFGIETHLIPHNPHGLRAKRTDH